MPDPSNPLEAINPFSRAVVHLTMYFNAEPDLASPKRQKLGTGTGFIREIGQRYFLITARHNLTGRHPSNEKPISDTCGIPNEVLLEGYYNRLNIQLYTGANNPNDLDSCPAVFRQHPTDPTIDLAVLPFTAASDWPIAWDENFFDGGLNERFIKLEVTQTCFVVGFPMDLVDRQDPHHVLPIYKTANIASEPYLDFQGKPIVVIDATTRPGMSGSPVIIREAHYGSYRHRFLGVYTGRFPRLAKGDDSALGIVYKPKVIREIFASMEL
jgi:hypothetical protein